MVESDRKESGVRILCFLIGLGIVFGTVGYVEMNNDFDWVTVIGHSILGFGLMWYGKGAVDNEE